MWIISHLINAGYKIDTIDTFCEQASLRPMLSESLHGTDSR